MGGNSGPRAPTPEEKRQQVKAYYQTFSQWKTEGAETYKQRRGLAEARLAASGAKRGSDTWNRGMENLEAEYAKDQESLATGQHMKTLKDYWTTSSRKRIHMGKSFRTTGDYSPAEQMARQQVDEELGGWQTKTTKRFRRPSTTWYEKDGERMGESEFEKMRDQMYGERTKALANDEEAMMSWYEQEFGAAEEADVDPQEEGMKSARRAASGGRQSAAWSISQGQTEDEPWL